MLVAPKLSVASSVNSTADFAARPGIVALKMPSPATASPLVPASFIVTVVKVVDGSLR